MQTTIDAHSFAGGVIEPRLWNRVNLDGYKIGAAVLDNVVVLPQGGVQRRPGLEYIDELPSDAKLIPFSFSTEENYLLVFYVETDEKMKVYKNGTLITDINGSGDDFLTITVVTFTKANILACNWAQSADTLFIVQEDIPPFSIVRGATDALWTQTKITLNNIPKVDFHDVLSPTPTSEVQDISINGISAGERYRLSIEGVTTEDIVFADIAGGPNAERIQTALRGLPIIFPRADLTVAATAPNRFVITFANGLAKNWEPISIVDPYGGGITATANSTVDGSPRTEDAWSSTRGWPKTITFHDSRIWFGGSKSLPQSLWATCVSEFTTTTMDFDYGTGFDDEGIGVTLDTDQVNAITGIVSGRHLQVLTTGGEFVAMEHPITPNNVTFTRQSTYGSSSVAPVSIDGATLFMQRTGRALREYLYTDVEQAYTANSLSLLASHILSNPQDMDALVGTSDDDANYVYVVNDDGTVAVLNTLRDMEIAGWTTFSTDGDFLRVGVDDQTTYFLIERVIDGSTVYYLERLNKNCFVDSAVLYVAPHVALYSGLSHLEGETVRIRSDGLILSDEIVVSGELTADRAAATGAQIGMNFNTTVTTLPLNQETQQGSTVMRKARVVRTTLHLYESLGVLVDGERLADMSFPGTLGASNDPFTGLKEIRNLGWGRLQQQTFSQVDPVPMTILGVEYLMKVNF